MYCHLRTETKFYKSREMPPSLLGHNPWSLHALPTVLKICHSNKAQGLERRKEEGSVDLDSRGV